MYKVGMHIYTVGIYVYAFLVRLAAIFKSKPRKMILGHRKVFRLLAEKREKDAEYLWFHAASLGEFEQARPMMEYIKKNRPEYKILLTFFSPSGYEVQKNYEAADIVCYLPFDTPRNVRRFLDLANPTKAFFIKYEFWENYFNALYRREIPVYSVSAIFRKDQIFFKWYGGLYREFLEDLIHIFLQNEESEQLLASIRITHVSVVGDTRFDRVVQVKQQAKELPLVKQFKGEALTMVAGSSWKPDEDLFINYFNTHPGMKLIIAPHVIDKKHLAEIEAKLKRPCIRYSQANESNISQADCLIIDCFGLLSSIYRYGEIAYIGGGFGKGIHNILEAAVYGVPVIFGPKHSKFMEAKELLEAGGAFSIQTGEELNSCLDRLLGDAAFLEQAGGNAGRYVEERTGATERILKRARLY